MGKFLWRVDWNLAGTIGPKQILEFGDEDTAMGWAQGLVDGGANGVFVTELITGRPIRIDNGETSGFLFS